MIFGQDFLHVNIDHRGTLEGPCMVLFYQGSTKIGLAGSINLGLIFDVHKGPGGRPKPW